MIGGGKFLFTQQLGAGWGNHGYGEMSFGYARAYTNDAVWMHCGAEGSNFRPGGTRPNRCR